MTLTPTARIFHPLNWGVHVDLRPGKIVWRSRSAFGMIDGNLLAIDIIDIDDDDEELQHGALPLVSKVSARGLHGRLNYDLDFKIEGRNGNLALLYGDNGSGKTTLLRLLWDLLSPAPLKHHRTRAAQVAFRQISIFLTEGTEIRATRKLAAPGPYTTEIVRSGVLQSQVSWPDRLPYEEFIEELPPAEYARMLSGQDEELQRAASNVDARRAYFDCLARLGSAPYFLSDNRRSSSDEVEESNYIPSGGTKRLSDRDERFVNPIADELAVALRHVNARLRRLTLRASVQGSAGSNSVYLAVVRQLANSRALTTDPLVTRTELLGQIQALGEKNAQFAALDLVSEFNTTELQENVTAVHERDLASLRSIIEPYFKSLTARLDALEDARSLIQTLLDEANLYLTDKRLVYRRRNLRIELQDGSLLNADQLSSGECHVLLLLFNAVLASGTSRLFIIDEPELSLNVKWQRRILRSLLALTEGTGLQFLLATHSIELLSSYRERVVVLKPVELAGDE
jgi:energy-coupling factor transporter ATP-binding protein EcfA2